MVALGRARGIAILVFKGLSSQFHTLAYHRLIRCAIFTINFYRAKYVSLMEMVALGGPPSYILAILIGSDGDPLLF